MKYGSETFIDLRRNWFWDEL